MKLLKSKKNVVNPTAIQGGSEKSKLLTISVFSVSQGSVEALIR